MQEISKIVVPVDLHQNTDVLVAFALDIAKKLDAEMNFIHVIPPLDSYSGVSHPSWGEIEQQMVANAEEKINSFVADNKDKCAGCNGKVVMGDIVDHIVAYCKEENASMIIIGTHGRKGLEKIMVGSVANAVIGKAPCPTLLFNPYK